MTGQFVSGKETDELDNSLTEKVLELSLETEQEREVRIFTEDPSDPLTGGDDYDTYDDYRRFDAHYDERDYWCGCLGLEFDAPIDVETEAWAVWKYGRKFSHLWENDHADKVETLGEAYQHLPTFEARRHTLIRDSKIYWCAFEDLDRRRYDNNQGIRTQKGKTSRFNKKNRVCEDHIRVARQNSARQMNNVWLTEMTGSTLSWTAVSRSHVLAEIVEDVHAHLDEINEELWWLVERDNEHNDFHWRYYHAGPMTESLQNCHGFSGDPLDEPLPEPEYRFDPLSSSFYYDDGRDYDFWDTEFYDDYPEDYGNGLGFTYDDPVDRYEYGILTEEDELYLDAEAAAQEAVEEAREAEFEHIAVGNAVGRRMQLAARAA